MEWFGAVSTPSRRARLLLLVLAFAPALATGVLVARHAVNTPAWDDWERGPIPLGPPSPRPEPERFDQLALADPDADGDGVPLDPGADIVGLPRLADVCPGVPEDRDGFEDHDGCPDPDDESFP